MIYLLISLMVAVTIIIIIPLLFWIIFVDKLNIKSLKTVYKFLFKQ